MSVIDDLADALAKDAIAVATRAGDDDIIYKTAKIFGGDIIHDGRSLYDINSRALGRTARTRVFERRSGQVKKRAPNLGHSTRVPLITP